jgi:hypothetical protein
MARSGPVTTDTSTIALGLAQIRVLDSSTYIGNINPQGAAADSIGALANTKFTGNTDWFRLESGFPLLEDYVVPIREAAMLECAFKEITPYNMAISYGLDPTGGGYTEAHSGEVGLGARVAPAYVRMEARYTFPNGSNYMDIIFPRAQVSAAVEMDLQSEDAAAVPVVFEAKAADDSVSGGSPAWNSYPLGRIAWS